MIREQSFGIIPLRKENDTWQVFLILHKGGNHWGFPKGKKVVGETSEQAAIRELKEETGLDVLEFLRKEPFLEKYQFRRKYQIIAKEVHYYPAFVAGKIVLQPEEIVDGKWVTLKEALAILTFKEGRSICEKLAHELV